MQNLSNLQHFILYIAKALLAICIKAFHKLGKKIQYLVAWGEAWWLMPPAHAWQIFHVVSLVALLVNHGPA